MTAAPNSQDPGQGQAQGLPQGQGSPQGQAQTKGPQTRPQFTLICPRELAEIPWLGAEERAKYELGLHSLWRTVDINAPDTKEHQTARQKLIEFSSQFHAKNNHYRMAQMQQAQQQAQQQQSQGAGVGTAGATGAAQGAGQPQPAHAQQQQQMASVGQDGNTAKDTSQAPPAPNTAAPNANIPGAGLQQAQMRPGQAAQPAPGAQQGPFPPHLLLLSQATIVGIPPGVALGDTPATVWITNERRKFIQAHMSVDACEHRIRGFDNLLSQLKSSGTAKSDEIERAKQQTIVKRAEALKFIDHTRKSQEPLKQQRQAQSQRQSQQGHQGLNSGLQSAQASMNAAIDAAKNQQMRGAVVPPGGALSKPPGQVPGKAEPGAASPLPPQAPVLQRQQQQQQQPVGSSILGTAPTVQGQGQQQVGTPGQAQVAVKLEHPQAHYPANTAMTGSAATTSNLAQQANAMRVQTPQISTPAGPPRALSISAATSKANMQHTARAIGTPTATSTSNVGNGSNAHAPIPNRLPIPKQLPERATAVPIPVSLGGGVVAGRPTMTSGGASLGGAMGQPAVLRAPTVNFEAEGDHVLSKKKLDELVRQVTGGSDESQENLLTPEVEENVLNLADNFVDSVIHSACRLAKNRGSKTLEIRDIQLVLERTYNIRIPGYSSDELRTVRKIQPAPGWIAKMSAIQAAKVMPGKGE